MIQAFCCPNCVRPISDDGRYSGIIVTCPYCSFQMQMPGAAEPPVAEPPITESTQLRIATPTPAFSERRRNPWPLKLTLAGAAGGAVLLVIWAIITFQSGGTKQQPPAARVSTPKIKGIRRDDPGVQQLTDVAKAGVAPVAAPPMPRKPETNLVDRIVEVVLNPTSTKYRQAGFRNFSWGDSKDESQRKLESTKLTPLEFQKLHFDSRAKLVGYARSYNDTLPTLTAMVTENFGPATDIQESSHSDPSSGSVYSTTKATYIFPESVIVATFNRRTTTGSVPSAQLVVYSLDRDYARKELNDSLKAVMPAFDHLKRSLEAVSRNRPDLANLASVDPSTTRKPLEVEDQINGYIESKSRWYAVAPGPQFFEDIGPVFRMAVVGNDYVHDPPFKSQYPGDVAATLWIDNFIGSKDHAVRSTQIGFLLERAYIEVALDLFPSPDGTYKRVENQGRVSFQWRTVESANVNVSIDAGSERVVVNRSSGRKL